MPVNASFNESTADYGRMLMIEYSVRIGSYYYSHGLSMSGVDGAEGAFRARHIEALRGRHLWDFWRYLGAA